MQTHKNKHTDTHVNPHTHTHNYAQTRAHTCTHLLEANVLRTLPEALTADVETVLADQTVAVTAHTAVRRRGDRGRWGFCVRNTGVVVVVVCSQNE